MIRGFYTAVAGMSSEMTDISALSNDVSNQATIGYKGDFDSMLMASANPLSYGMGGLVRGTGVLSTVTSLDLTQGALQQTTNPFDMALQGPGFFALQTPTGTMYTRNGAFHIAANGQLVNADGNVVLGANKAPIQFPDLQGKAVTVGVNGVVQVGTLTIGQIGVFNAAGWAKSGADLFTPVGAVTAAPQTFIRQSMLEQSNVNLSAVLGSMISSQRAFSASAQMQQYAYQMLTEATDSIAK